MMADQVIEQAQRSAATPADGAPAERNVEQQRMALQADLFGSDAGKKAAALTQLQRLTADPETVAKADKAKAEAEAKVTPAEARIKKANQNPALWDKNHKDHAAAVKELKSAIAAADAPEDRDALVAGGITAALNIYGLSVPQDIANMGKDAVAAYEENYSQWESDFLIEARDHGLDNKLVGQLRDAGVKLGLQVDGTPLSDETVAEALKPFAGQLTTKQITALKAYWRRIEGGA
jgi:hypothetical protein